MKPHIFGVRHLSPMGAFQLSRYLDEHSPRCVLIEGPADCSVLIPQLTSPGVTPPIAILAYTASEPVMSSSLPFAGYSPEYFAISWAAAHNVLCRFIDLPTELSIAARVSDIDAPDDETEETFKRKIEFNIYRNMLYDEIARIDGWESHDEWWEASFEHNANPDAYHKGVIEYSKQMRELIESREQEENPGSYRYNALREAYMRREIEHAISEGYAPDEIVAVCGAYHVTGLLSEAPALTDAELEALPRRETKLTLMPYSYFKLSSQSGYGAGNIAPAYFERMWQCLSDDEPRRLAALYLSELGTVLRSQGGLASTASVVEAVRLAEAMAALRGNSNPVLPDLHSAAIACLGQGELSNIATAVMETDVGTAIGSLPEGVSQTPVQDDFNRHLKQLKLEKYKSTIAQDVELDLRENRRVKSEAAAFLDLDRSTFLHRLSTLGIPFAHKAEVNRQNSTWYEKWALKWSPEAEIALVEATLSGETVELAVSNVIKTRLDGCGDVLSTAKIIAAACECRLLTSCRDALRTLQALSVDAGSVAQIAGAAYELSVQISYGDIRRFDTSELTPLLTQLFLRACLLMPESAVCDDKAAVEILGAINLLHIISQERYGDIDDELWLVQLKELAFGNGRNPRLSGVAFSILLERGEICEDEYSAEVSRRLSPGVPAAEGAGWFEGLADRNRYALLSRMTLWRELDNYIGALDDDEFIRCTALLRRAFSSFEPGEKNSAAEILGQIWGLDTRDTAELLMTPLTQEQESALDELSDFDFEDF